MKLFLTFIVSFFITNIYAQTNNIQRISLHHQNSIIIDSDIYIYFYQDFNRKFYVDVKTSKMENKYSVSNEKASELIASVSKISPTDIAKEVRNCLDGSDTVIEFSSSIIAGNSVTYSINCLSSEDYKTSWSDYLMTVNLILEIAKLKFSDLK